MGGVGALAAYLDRNERSKAPIYFQLFVVLFTYYTMYTSSYKLWTTLVFSKTFSGKVNENYFFYVNYLELFTLVFIRTRTSIKYFAKNITIANMMYLVYVNSHMYAAQHEGLLLLISYSITVLAYFIYKFEC